MIPLTPDALACLREWRDRVQAHRGTKAAGWVWPGSDNWRGESNRDRTRAHGNCKVAICRIAERAGVKDIGWHTLRHTFASWLVMRGVPLRVVQELLGHASIKMTERYAHLAKDAVNHAVVASLDIPLIMTPTMPALPPGDDDAADS